MPEISQDLLTLQESGYSLLALPTDVIFQIGELLDAKAAAIFGTISTQLFSMIYSSPRHSARIEIAKFGDRVSQELERKYPKQVNSIRKLIFSKLPPIGTSIPEYFQDYKEQTIDILKGLSSRRVNVHL